MNTKIWIALVGLSVFAFVLGYMEMMNRFFVALLLLSTWVKGQLVSDYFMTLRNVSLQWRIIPLLWLGVVIVLIAVAYYVPVTNAL